MIKLSKKLFNCSYEDTVQNIIKLIECNKNSKYLDLGCYDGKYTLRFAHKLKTKDILGIEFDGKGAKISKSKGIKIVGRELNKKWDIIDNSIDVITSNMVIEHLYDTDHFVKEIKRVLKLGGYAIIATNNLSSWHNFLPLLLGRQPFPSDVSGYNEVGKLFTFAPGWGGSFAHLRVFSYYALREIFQKYGFEVEKHVGVGYYPFPKFISRLFSHIDPIHSAFHIVKVMKTTK